MFVPVTTKPFLNSVNFKVLQWVSLHYFSLIKEKLTNILLPAKTGFTGVTPSALRDCSTYQFRRVTFRLYTLLSELEFHK